jgi:elongation factor G
LDGNVLPVPEQFKRAVEKARVEMLELAAESDDKLMEKYLETLDLSTEEIARGIKSGVKAGKAVIAVAGSATLNIGIPRLMDNIIKYLQSPVTNVKTGTVNGMQSEIVSDPSGYVVAQVFKTTVDPFFGKLNIFKVLRGTVKSGMILTNTTKGIDEKIGMFITYKAKTPFRQMRLRQGHRRFFKTCKYINRRHLAKGNGSYGLPLRFPPR